MIAINQNLQPSQQRRRSILGSSSVRLIYGVHDFQTDIAGLTVAETLNAFRDVLSVSNDADCFVNGSKVNGSARLHAGDRLEFVKRWGRKGNSEELRRIMLAVEELAAKTKEVESAIRRIADHFDPPQRASVTSSYVAERLGRTVRWVGELARTGVIPASCICPRSGDGKYWRFWKEKIDQWIDENK